MRTGRKPLPARLEDCKWCGYNTDRKDCHRYPEGGYGQACANCGMVGPAADTKRQAMETWNRLMRHTVSPESF